MVGSAVGALVGAVGSAVGFIVGSMDGDAVGAVVLNNNGASGPESAEDDGFKMIKYATATVVINNKAVTATPMHLEWESGFLGRVGINGVISS